MMDLEVMTSRIVIFHPDPRTAAKYEELLKGQPGLTLGTAHTERELAERLPQADVVFGWRFPAHTLGGARHLRFVQVMSAGVDDLLRAPGFDRTIPLACARGTYGPLMTEYVLAMLLAVEKEVRRLFRQQEERIWKSFRPGYLRGKVLGLAGLGSTLQLARVADALGMVVLGYRRQPEPVAGVREVYGPDRFIPFLRELDYLVLALPLTPETEGFLGLPEFRQMKPSAWLINIGRGRIVREPELVEALSTRVIRGAILDVFAEEPLPASSPLWALDNAVITPHLAAASIPETMVALLLENLDNWRAGRPLKGLVDPDRGY
ncbi:MAG TPA: hydroxyacid dehydrogenase [Clostridiales bacterium]|nr:hydroxyacid dehydrogenase [Clostridiales bacterium]